MNTILFDLDGTLLPMNQEEFVETYFSGLAKKGNELGIDPNTLIKVVWQGTNAMLENNGEKTNEEVFWDTFAGYLGEESRNSIPVFEDFYRHEFHQVKAVTQPRKQVDELIKLLKDKGYRLILATNPIFPRIATQARMQWAGLQEEDFAWVTTYENSSYAKPNLAYYQEILVNNQVDAHNCWMIGNDVGDDMVASKLGMKTFLVTDCLIAKEGAALHADRSGDFEALMEFAKSLPELQQA